jgi:hypothetical protein
MLPGFRFLFAAIVLSLSILIFGLGAAALLRAAHEQFASLPTRRAPAEPVFTKQNAAPVTTLALLRFEPPVLEKPSENVPAVVTSAVVTPDAVAPAAQAPEATPAEPEKLAALPEEPMLAEAAKPAAPATETTAEPAAVIESEAPPAATEEVKVAAVTETPAPPPLATAPVAPEPPTADKPSTEGNLAATRIATLGGPVVIIDEKVANEADARQDRNAVRKRAAQRARERRRIAARRARLAAARQAALLAQQQANNPFAQTIGQTPVARAAQ